MKPFSGANYRRNEKRCGPLDPCAYCGKAITNRAKALGVLVCCSQFDPGHPESCVGNQGGLLLGPDCARRYRKERGQI